MLGGVSIGPAQEPEKAEPGAFATTRWSLIARSGDGDEAVAGKALAELCELYWPPVYLYLRRKAGDASHAEDLTQEFFARILEHRNLHHAKVERGRFRAYLLGSLRHFLSRERRHDAAQKRGGGVTIASLDGGLEEQASLLRTAYHRDPLLAYEKAWALTLLEHVLQELGEQYRRRGRGRLFEELRSTLTGERTQPLDAIAEKLSRTVGAVKVAAHRLRGEFGQILRRHIRETVESEAEVEDEIRALFRSLSL